jgi:hypothetical protein
MAIVDLLIIFEAVLDYKRRNLMTIKSPAQYEEVDFVVAATRSG